jgi:antitoxin (DNA-binding transcriptional repressor) of toxin-antitoxin stability system
MRAVTMRQAKATLNELVEAATRGEQVVLMRGAKHVAAIVPLSADDLEISFRLDEPQAERLWQQIAAERRSGALREFASPKAAVAHLAGQPRPRRRRLGAAERAPGS